MPVEVILPKVDMDMTHGTIATWHVPEGEAVAKGAPLFDIETDKAAMEVEAPASGILRQIKAVPGTKVPVGAVVAYLYGADEAIADTAGADAPGADAPTAGDAPAAPVAAVAETPAPAAQPASAQSSPAIAVASPEAAATAEPEGGTAATTVRATPAARHEARLGGIDLAGIVGSGPFGRVQRQDVQERLARAVDEAGPLRAAGWTPEGGPLKVTRRPGEGRPLVLIHGFAADSTGWLPLERNLSSRHPLLRIDLPGHGGSPKRPVEDFSHLVRITLEAFDAATADAGPVHLLGHSLGGALATAIADLRGRRVASLTAIAPAGLGPEIRAEALGGIARASRVESLLPWLKLLTGDPQGIDEDYARAAMRSRSDPALRAYQLALVDRLFPDGVPAFDLKPALSRLTMPVALVWGRRDQIVASRQALAPEGDFALHFLAGIGHIPQIECPDRVARIVERHLAASLVAG